MRPVAAGLVTVLLVALVALAPGAAVAAPEASRPPAGVALHATADVVALPATDAPAGPESEGPPVGALALGGGIGLAVLLGAVLLARRRDDDDR